LHPAKNVTNVTKNSHSNPDKIGLNECNVTCNVYETEVKRNGNAIEIEVELERELGGIHAQDEPLHADNDVLNKI
jgi:hypothetical protein